MVAGLPGTGIGGCFFLLSALLMPLVEIGRTVRGRSGRGRWAFVLAHSTTALGILSAMWATGWAIGLVLYALIKRSAAAAGVAKALEPRNFLEAPPVVLTLLTLLAALLSVGALRALFGRRDVRRVLAGRSKNA